MRRTRFPAPRPHPHSVPAPSLRPRFPAPRPHPRSAPAPRRAHFPLEMEQPMRYNPFCTCRCGGIGRRPGLKIPCPQGRAGSTPATGTMSSQAAYRLRRLFCFASRVISRSPPLFAIRSKQKKNKPAGRSSRLCTIRSFCVIHSTDRDSAIQPFLQSNKHFLLIFSRYCPALIRGIMMTKLAVGISSPVKRYGLSYLGLTWI